MILTDLKIKQAKPRVKTYRISDGAGLYLEISPKGGKWWRLKYRFDGREKRLSMGVYPQVSLRAARERREEARKLLADGVDPSENRKAIKMAKEDQAANSFEVIAKEWLAKHSSQWTPGHTKNITRRLERNIYPWLGHHPISDIRAPELLDILRRAEARGALETAHRALQNCGQIFRYAVVTGRAERDPSMDLKGALTPVKSKHLAAITDPDAVGQLLRAIDSYEGHYVTQYALRLAPLVFVRPWELRGAEWQEINLKKAEWNIPAERMKMREPHLVPLSKQAVAILKDIHPLTSKGRYVFPSIRSMNRPMSNNAILAALRRMGYEKHEMTGHGFRAMARTILDEVLGVRPDFIEHQLAHSVRDPNGRAYNRTTHLAQRKKMMQQWADYLDGLKAGAKVIPLSAS